MEQDKSELSLYEKVQAEKKHASDSDSTYKEKLISHSRKHYLGEEPAKPERKVDLKRLSYPERLMKLSRWHYLGE